MFHFHRNIQRCALSYREFLRTIPLSTNKKKRKKKNKEEKQKYLSFFTSTAHISENACTRRLAIYKQKHAAQANKKETNIKISHSNFDVVI